ncbi:hypothetical protein CIT31_13860 [Mesorhizobium wenxiniae]|uniref:Uncharacterized protein n=1 Tax=Mesorhizobium wenxiniae TaxID=2014805 RepID=A0A271KHA5_9HYPH|nr:hypothetical protein CIT31_13860 [Mesorhizobium wenxiniae]
MVKRIPGGWNLLPLLSGVTSQHLLPLARNRKRPAPPPAGLFLCPAKYEVDAKALFAYSVAVLSDAQRTL